MSKEPQRKGKKERSTNFTGEEVRVLVSEMVKRGEIISGELSSTLTSGHKQAAWESILGCVNAVAPMIRKLESVKTKWKELKMKTKKKCVHNRREMGRTGGGEAELLPLTDIERLVETQIRRASKEGVGDLDTLEAAMTPRQSTDIVLNNDQLLVIWEESGEPSTSVEPQTNLATALTPPRSDDEPSRDEHEPPRDEHEPPRKRIRVRRSKEDLQRTIVNNQENLNKKIEEAIFMFAEKNAEISANHLRMANTMDRHESVHIRIALALEKLVEKLL